MLFVLDNGVFLISLDVLICLKGFLFVAIRMTANVRGYKIVGDCVIAKLSTVANLASGLKCK